MTPARRSRLARRVLAPAIAVAGAVLAMPLIVDAVIAAM